MFKKILVAYDGSPEAGRALIVGIQLAKSLKADLRTVYVYEKMPAYAAGYMDFGVNGPASCYPGRLLSTIECCRLMPNRQLINKA